MGTLTADDVLFSRVGAVGTILDVRGILQVQFTAFDGLPLSLTTSSGPAAHLVEDLNFGGAMTGSETQLFLRMPGGGTLQPSNMVFSTIPTTGVYVEVQSTNATEWVLEMDNPFPGSVSVAETLDDGVARIVWPWP